MKLQDALDALPKTAPLIAKFLQRRRIKGHRHQPTSCPIAHYLRKTVGDATVVRVNPMNCFIYKSDQSFSAEATDTPRHIRAFIHNFDVGCYPNLEAK